jgi:hypothetical protein
MVARTRECVADRTIAPMHSVDSAKVPTSGAATMLHAAKLMKILWNFSGGVNKALSEFA